MKCRQFSDDIPLSQKAIDDIANIKKVFAEARELLDEFMSLDGDKTTKAYEAFKRDKLKELEKLDI